MLLLTLPLKAVLASFTHMVLILIVFSTVAAILADLYIYRRVTARHRLPRGIKILYILIALAIDCMALFALLKLRNAESVSDAEFRKLMWAIALFFLNFFPKLLYSAVSLFDYPLGWMRKKTSHVFSRTGVVLAVVLAANMLYGMTLGRSTLRVETVELEFESLPASFDGLRVVQFSDLHVATLVNRDKFVGRVVDAVNDLSPDIVIQSGDIVNTRADELDETALRILGGIRATYGVYGVLGNHDLGIYVRDAERYPPGDNVARLGELQESIGWHMLRDETAYISNGTDTISVTGVDYPYDPSLNSSHVTTLAGCDVDKAYAGLADSVFNITISHAPQTWNEILARGKASLTVAGHVHAMQIKVPFGDKGRGWSPAKWVYDRWSGLYEQDGRYLYINDGLGYVMFPMRIGTKPELTLFILRSADKTTQE